MSFLGLARWLGEVRLLAATSVCLSLVPGVHSRRELTSYTLSSDLKRPLVFSQTNKTKCKKNYLKHAIWEDTSPTRQYKSSTFIGSKTLMGNPDNARSLLDSDNFWVARRP